jgi:peptide/nickel transport system permease protein
VADALALEPSLPAPSPPGPESRRQLRGGTTWFVLSKVGASLLSLVFIAIFNFFLFRVLPGDPAKILTRNHAVPPERIAELRHEFGLDLPLWKQFGVYIWNLLHGNLGISFKYRQPVTTVIADRIWPTLLLVGTSTILCTFIGLWIGIRAAWRRDGTFDRVSTGVGLTFYSMPEFWLGMILILVFANGWGPFPGIFPTSGLIDADVEPASVQGVINVAYHLFLPVTTLTLAYLAEYSLVMRSSLLDEMGEDYLQTARAKGLRDDDVRRKHAVPNALLPSFTLSVLYLGFVLSGAITIETVFSIPGLGLLSYEALKVPDFPVLQGVFLLFSAGVIVANLVADLCYPLLDPRVRPA